MSTGCFIAVITIASTVIVSMLLRTLIAVLRIVVAGDVGDVVICIRLFLFLVSLNIVYPLIAMRSSLSFLCCCARAPNADSASQP